jgi:hypothetical protein
VRSTSWTLAAMAVVTGGTGMAEVDGAVSMVEDEVEVDVIAGGDFFEVRDGLHPRRESF